MGASFIKSEFPHSKFDPWVCLKRLCLALSAGGYTQAMRKQWTDDGRLRAIAEWKDLKYGLFIHYGLYSLCGGVWKGRRVERGYSEQILSHGDVPQADYERLTDFFTAESFNADDMAVLAKAAGMNYIVMVSKHHDGFCLFDTKTTDYSSMNASCHRDLVMELSIACRKYGLKFGLYFSWIDWHCPSALPISPHNSDRIPDDHMKYNLAQLTELLSNYGPICELWMDMGAPTEQQSAMVQELAHRLQPGIMLNGRVWNDYGDFITMADNAYPDCELNVPWQTPATIYHSTWGYRSWQERTGLDEKVREIASKVRSVVEGGGNYLLNVGPAGDGSVVPFERDVLIGVWEILSKEGLSRRSEGFDAKRLSEMTLSNGCPECRFSGADYYSLRKIVTGYSWDVLVEADGDYCIEYELDKNLEKECKLCLDTNEETFVFSMRQGVRTMVICSSVRLKAGCERIELYTPGESVRRSEFPLENVTIRLHGKRHQEKVL